MHQHSTPRRRSAWGSAKSWILASWDNPPAMLVWLLLTGATVGLLKAAGL